MVNSQLKLPRTTSSFSCLQKQEKEGISLLTVPFYQGGKTFRKSGGKTFRKSPADFLMGAFDRIRLLDHAAAVGRLVKQVSAIFSLYTGKWALLRRGGGVEVAVD